MTLRKHVRHRRRRNGVGHLAATQKKDSYAHRNARRAIQKESRKRNRG